MSALAQTPAPDPATKPVPKPKAAKTTARRVKRRRLLLAAVILLIGGLVFGATLRHRKTPPPAPAKPASVVSNTPDDLVIADASQQKQITVEAVPEQAIQIEKEVTGKIGFNEDRLTPVFMPYAGRVVEVLANKGDATSAGKSLLVIEAPELVAAQNDLSAARSDVAKAKLTFEIARKNADRTRHLVEQEAQATKDLQLAENDLLRASADLERANAAQALIESRLVIFGKTPQEIAKLGDQAAPIDRRVKIFAPLTGTIVERKVGPGQYIKPDALDALLLISDLSTLWVWGDVYESDMAHVHLGTPVQITVAAAPNHIFPAHVSFINPTVDPATRSVRVRCLVSNVGGVLKPEMFAKLKLSGLTQSVVATVPANAFITEGNDSFIFVAESSDH